MTKMHENELEIEENLVRELLKNQCPQWADLSISPIKSTGTDNALFLLGTKYVVRLPRVELAAELAGFLNAFHKINLKDGPASRRGIRLNDKELDAETKMAIGKLKDEIDISQVSALWDQLSNIPYWSKEPVWIHGDLLPGNILVQDNRLTAVLDFTDVGVGDPACDLVIAWALLNPHSRQVFKINLENIDEDTWKRGQGWALSIALIMLPYYKHTNPVLAALARRMIENVLSDSGDR